MTSVTIYYDGTWFNVVDNAEPTKEFPRFKTLAMAWREMQRLMGAR